ncbi:MAG: response regulator [Promethearchaeota archaeon]
MSKAKILIIDDEIGLRDSLKRIVEKSGFIAETAMDFASAKKIVSKFKFDLFLVDLILPKMNGIQLMTRLKEEFEITGAILFFTGEPNLETCIEAIKLGALDYLEKPVEPSVLINTITQALIRKNHEVKILENTPKKEFIINNSPFFSHEKILKNIEEIKDNIHDILRTLKNKYGNDFNDDQRNLLNKIVENNGKLKKIIEELKSKTK